MIDNIVVWGTGKQGEWFLEELNILNNALKKYNIDFKVSRFIDKNLEKIGKEFFSYKIEAVESIFKVDEKPFVVIAVEKNKEIKELLTRNNYQAEVNMIEATIFIRCIVENVLDLDIGAKIEIYDYIIQNSPNNSWLADIYAGIGIIKLSQTNTLSDDIVIDALSNIVNSFTIGHVDTTHIINCFNSNSYLISNQNTYQKKINNALPKESDYQLIFHAIGESFFWNKKDDILVSTNDYYDDELTINDLYIVKDPTEKNAVFENALARYNDRCRFNMLFQLVEQMLNSNDISSQLIKYLKELEIINKHSIKFIWANAKFYFIKKEYDTALEIIECGLKQRILNTELLFLTGSIYEGKGDIKKAIGFYTKSIMKYVSLKFGVEMEWINPEEVSDKINQSLRRCFEKAKTVSEAFLQECLEEMSDSLVKMREFPFRFKITNADNYNNLLEICVGKNGLVNIKDEEYIIGLYKQMRFFNIKKLYFKLTGNNKHNDLITQIMYSPGWCILKGKFSKQYVNNSKDMTYILPVMATEDMQQINIDYDNKEYSYDFLSKKNDDVEELLFPENEWKLIRVNKAIKIESNKSIGFGKPIIFNKTRGSRKVAINIIADALSEATIKDQLSYLMPNSEKFFREGAIFEEAFSPNDWTIPSITSMFYGLEVQKTQVFHPGANVMVDAKYKSLAEKMSEEGYFCVNLSISGESLMLSGVTKGFDYQIAGRQITLEASIMKAIELLDSINTDIFINIHFLEIHDAIYDSGVTAGTGLELDIGHILECDNRSKRATDVVSSRDKNCSYEAEIRHCDKLLGILYQYLDENFSHENMLVSLVADHGLPIVGKEEYYLKDGQVNVPIMVRGGNCPTVGIVSDEVVSGMDIYQIYAKCCNFDDNTAQDSVLPAAFGGEGRKYVISQALYPSQTYKLNIRSLEYEFSLETLAKTQYDGSIDMRKFRYHLYDRKNNHKEIKNKKLASKFIEMALEYTKTMTI